MPERDSAQLLADASRWWSTEIVDIRPNEIRMRGYPIEELIGRVSFPEMIWLMLRGELPSPAQARLLEAALVAAVDHGPHAPSIAIARMAVTCGLPLNGAMASAINVLDDVHGGAGQQCMELLQQMASIEDEQGLDVAAAVAQAIESFTRDVSSVVPGFGHRFHEVDPRAVRLLSLVDDACSDGTATGRYARLGREIERQLSERKARPIPMNIDGITAVIYLELGFPPALGRGLFVLSRSVGILAHAWEQSRQGGRIKGPMPPTIPYTYAGASPRHFDDHTRKP